jgi:4-diphosphocytidyl-2-C-methyl-D-erythritol kinase
MLCFPNGKINIGLYITRRREDGYHDLETVFYPVKEMKDALEAVRGAAELHLGGATVRGNREDNIVWKAYELMRKHHDIPELEIWLQKAIPMGAGLGGGSADGAFMLQLINDYCKLGLSKEKLVAYALQLGSDCPFFIYNEPMFAKGRGEQLEPITLDLSEYRIELVCPQIHVSTKEAFSMLTPKPASFDLRKLASLPVREWKDHISNDFEAPVFARHPELKKIKQELYDKGALYASMSGSGSAVYGIFADLIM